MSERGPACEMCGCTTTNVMESRPTTGDAIRRRRECTACFERFTTYERVGKKDAALAQATMKRMRILMRKAIKISRESVR